MSFSKMLFRQCQGTVWLALAAAVFFPAGLQAETVRNDAPPEISWLADYGEAMKRAELGRKYLLVYFYENEPTVNQRRLETHGFTDPQLVERIEADCVAVRLPLGYEVSVGGERSPLLGFEAFADLNGRPGVALIDYAHQNEEYSGYVVSVLPLDNGKYYRFAPHYLNVMLDLPAGTLTQRTMIFAVRVHPDGPASTRGRPSRTLFAEAHDHSNHQARIRNQGHHNWGSRFQKLVGILGGGLRPQEVVAESWPGENLVDAAIDCVDCWRQSPGHWGAVRADQPQFGYDIKKGENGIWYATGLFGNKH
ncbi:MAG: hypothetical protein JNK76_14090 [Planctomycetales bacterium]|nr:hypothetical protein [Planctomycetales bacterium]MBN8624501.1 hypothetical protein [Planctomycetota bacterium]